MQPWHFYIVLGVCAAGGGVLQALAMRNPEFTYFSSARQVFTRIFCIAVPAVLVLLPYLVWSMSGFHTADVRSAENIIVQQYLKNGAQRVEAHFIIESRAVMTGYAEITFADGTVATVPCQAHKGDGAEFLAFCS